MGRDADQKAAPANPPRRLDMPLANAFLRIAVPLALMAAAVFGAGWKWELFPH
jgi:hypothetical protein